MVKESIWVLSLVSMLLSGWNPVEPTFAGEGGEQEVVTAQDLLDALALRRSGEEFDFFEFGLLWHTSLATPTSTPIPPTATPTPVEPAFPIGAYAQVGVRLVGFNTGQLYSGPAEVAFIPLTGAYVYRTNSFAITVEPDGDKLVGSRETGSPGSEILQEIELVNQGNDRYQFLYSTRNVAQPQTLTFQAEGEMYPQSQWGPFTGYFTGQSQPTVSFSNRNSPCIVNTSGSAISAHLLEVDGIVRMLDNSFAIPIHSRFDPDNLDALYFGGGVTAAWDGLTDGNYIGCSPVGTSSMDEVYRLVLTRNQDGSVLTGEFSREAPFTDGTFESITFSISLSRRNPF